MIERALPVPTSERESTKIEKRPSQLGTGTNGRDLGCLSVFLPLPLPLLLSSRSLSLTLCFVRSHLPCVLHAGGNRGSTDLLEKQEKDRGRERVPSSSLFPRPRSQEQTKGAVEQQVRWLEKLAAEANGLPPLPPPPSTTQSPPALLPPPNTHPFPKHTPLSRFASAQLSEPPEQHAPLPTDQRHQPLPPPTFVFQLTPASARGDKG